MSFIKIRELTKTFQDRKALDIASLDISSGEIIGVVGNNGAGKSTLFRAMTDLLQPDTGDIWIGDDLVLGSEHWKSVLHAFLDEGFLIEFLKPTEYLEFVGKTRGLSKAELEKQVSEMPELLNDDIVESKKMISELSTGSKVRVGLLAAFLGQPKVVLLDEPYAHLDPSTQARLSRLIKKKNEAGVTIILSSHNLHNMSEICHRLILIEKGAVLKDAHMSEQLIREISDYFQVT